MHSIPAMFFDPSGPWDFKSSIILTRVSTPKTLNTSLGCDSMVIGPLFD